MATVTGQPDYRAHKLGKRHALVDPRVPMLARYTRNLPDPPASVDAVEKGWQMLGNDQVGDCTCATVAHIVRQWTLLNDREYYPETPQVLALYTAAGGYDPQDPNTDQGAVIVDVLRFWHGNPLWGIELDAFASIEPGNRCHAKDAIWLFGAAYLGLELPVSAQTQQVWQVPPGGSLEGRGRPGTWGGHAVPVLGYDRNFLYCVTWGELKAMTWGFFSTYCSEAYALLSPDWADQDPPRGFDYATLQEDMKAVGKVVAV